MALSSCRRPLAKPLGAARAVALAPCVESARSFCLDKRRRLEGLLGGGRGQGRAESMVVWRRKERDVDIATIEAVASGVVVPDTRAEGGVVELVEALLRPV